MRQFKSVFLICFFFIVLTGLLNSCLQETDVEFNVKTQPELVLICMITPGDSIHAYVSRTFSISEKNINNDSVNINAHVILSDESGNKILLRRQANSPRYSVAQDDLKIRPGKNYTIEVRAPGFETIRAQTTVPVKAAEWKRLDVTLPQGGRYSVTGDWLPVYPSNDLYGYGVVVLQEGEFLDVLKGNIGVKFQSDLFTFQRSLYLGPNAKIALITKDRSLYEFSKMAELTREINYSRQEDGFFDFLSMFKGNIPKVNFLENGVGIFGSYLISEQSIP